MRGDPNGSSTHQPYPLITGMETADAKDELRRAIRAQRAARTSRQRAEAAVAFADVLETVPAVRDAVCVATYAARTTEPGTGVLLERLAARGARVLLPVLGAGLARDWAEYTGPDELRERAPGRPPEPPGPALGAHAVAEADVVIAPALAVDSRGVRLGQGGGWYDRVLELKRDGVTVVAMVFPEEVYDAAERPLPSEEHDIPVDAVATPEGWHTLR
ncbi:5-formyltetrahydrofolate cyclo-ligase [Xylanimonas oleitrophica]|uniref:5-formyltetrahydrofolate cyclo-ligase n=1 Tax=Xylanimonas oleitrophica TaxID=2607479 RepID=A0A2W5YH51_9MICO|nr:5-formyltetrahydrofolate cyclo-ligase [Xylanimonas oleitrophica]PZR54201.1 5-formyltetrahydrofolate cyclo-ligase [Xylanimonas oleitrophica]